MKRFNVGVIGYGWASTAHIEAINATSNGRVVAVFSSRALDTAALASRHGYAISVFGSLEEMLLSKDIDAVAICSLPSLHVDQAVAAATAGKHIILEKPIALDWAGAARLLEAVERKGVKCCVCFELRFASQLLATRSMIDSGVLGMIHYGEVDYCHGIGPWYGQYRWNTTRANGGSSLLSAGCHAVDSLLYCMGGEVESVMSRSTRSANPVFQAYEYDTTSVTILKFRDGRLGKVASVIDCFQPYYFRTYFVGSEGTMLDDRFHSERFPGSDRKQWSRLAMKLADSGDVSDHPYRAQFEAFFAATAAGADMPHTNLRDALRSHRVIMAADLSARCGREIALKDVA